jgi:DNA-binding NarL/FixJ family response regulator
MSKKIILGHKDKGYSELLRKALIRNGYLWRNITLAQNKLEFIALCKKNTFDVVIISDNLKLHRRFEFKSSSPFPIKKDTQKLILLADSVSIANYKGKFWANASIIDYQNENISRILSVIGTSSRQTYLSPTLIWAVTQQRKKKTYNPELSKSDLEVLKLVCADNSSEDIASRLNKSKRTIDGQRLKLKKVLGVRGIAGLIYFALENGIFDTDEY